jgi:hypothetical protein
MCKESRKIQSLNKKPDIPKKEDAKVQSRLVLELQPQIQRGQDISLIKNRFREKNI